MNPSFYFLVLLLVGLLFSIVFHSLSEKMIRSSLNSAIISCIFLAIVLGILFPEALPGIGVIMAFPLILIMSLVIGIIYKVARRVRAKNLQLDPEK